MIKDTGFFIDNKEEPAWVPDLIKEWKYCRSYEEVFKNIGEYVREHKQFPPLMVINHDLTEEMKVWSEGNKGVPYIYDKFEEKSGMHVVALLEKYSQKRGIKFDNIVCSSCANPIGAKNLKDYVNFCKKKQGLEENCFALKFETKKEEEKHV